MRQIFFGTILFMVALILVSLTASRPSSAQLADPVANCNIRNVVGSYAYAGFGTIGTNPIGLPPGPYNTAARLSMDGKGNYTVDAMTSYSGTLMPEHYEGTYEVGEGCGITFNVQFPGAPSSLPAVFAYFSGNHSETRGISLLPGTNITYLTARQ